MEKSVYFTRGQNHAQKWNQNDCKRLFLTIGITAGYDWSENKSKDERTWFCVCRKHSRKDEIDLFLGDPAFVQRISIESTLQPKRK